MKTFHSNSSAGGLPAQPKLTSRSNHPPTPDTRPSGLWRAFLLLGSIAAALLGGWTNGYASDPVGIYAYVDKVVFEPTATAPEKVQVWGGFSLAEGPGGDYAPAKAGFMYFQIKPGDETLCRNEWNDLKSLAGTGQLVAFGNRHKPKGTVRNADAKVEKPDPYSIGFGLIKVKEESKGVGNSDYKPIKELRALREQQKKAGSGSAPAAPTKPTGN